MSAAPRMPPHGVRPSPARKRAVAGDFSVLWWPIAKVEAARIVYYMRLDGMHAKTAYYNITGRDATNHSWKRVERVIARKILDEIIRIERPDDAVARAA